MFGEYLWSKKTIIATERKRWGETEKEERGGGDENTHNDDDSGKNGNVARNSKIRGGNTVRLARPLCRYANARDT